MPAPSLRPVRRLCIHWPRLGPYHLARLHGVQRFLPEHGAELVALETAGRDATYAWRLEEGSTPFQREQVFPDRVFEALSAAEVHAGVTAALDRLQPDAVAVNSYGYPDARACLAWCRRHRRVAVVMTDSKADDAPRSAWRERAKALIVRQFDAALVAGSPHHAYLEGLGIPRTHIFSGYDVVDNDYFRSRAEEARRDPASHRRLPGLEDDTPFFLASSRFIGRKNLDTLLRAYARYRAEAVPPWRLLILGDGPERALLEAIVAGERIEGVVFCGFRQIEELPVYYGMAGAFIHPALVDQWGLVVNEAMAAGLPVLVSERVGCAQDLVDEGRNGFRFDPTDPARLAELMRRTASPETDRVRMGFHSQQIIARWSPDSFARQLWRAVEAGRERACRRYGPVSRLALWLLRRAAPGLPSPTP